MKLAIKIYFIIYFLSVDVIYAISDIDDLKRNSNNYISAIKNEYLTIKNKITSPYNKKQFSYKSYLDSLHFLSEKLDTQRKKLFSDLKELNLTSKDAQFFDKFNRDSILLYNIINGFGMIYYNYLYFDDTKKDYSYEKFTFDIKNLTILEQKIFSK